MYILKTGTLKKYKVGGGIILNPSEKITFEDLENTSLEHLGLKSVYDSSWGIYHKSKWYWVYWMKNSRGEAYKSPDIEPLHYNCFGYRGNNSNYPKHCTVDLLPEGMRDAVAEYTEIYKPKEPYDPKIELDALREDIMSTLKKYNDVIGIDSHYRVAAHNVVNYILSLRSQK